MIVQKFEVDPAVVVPRIAEREGEDVRLGFSAVVQRGLTVPPHPREGLPEVVGGVREGVKCV